MTNEEFEKRKEFILDHQAQFAIDIQQLRESQAELQAAQVRTEQVVVQTGEIVARLANGTLEGFRDVNAKINALSRFANKNRREDAGAFRFSDANNGGLEKSDRSCRSLLQRRSKWKLIRTLKLLRFLESQRLD